MRVDDGSRSDRPIFFSPHLDDACLSCGGTIRLAANRGHRPLLVTLFAGFPPPGLDSEIIRHFHRRHARGADPIASRRNEDAEAAAILGADTLWLPFPEALYREPVCRSFWELFGALREQDAAVVDQLVPQVIGILGDRRRPGYFPLGIGGHRDHRIARAVGAAVHESGYRVRFYEDYPYAENANDVAGGTMTPDVVDVTETVAARVQAIAAYRSQLPLLFPQADVAARVTAFAAVRDGDRTRFVERFWVP